MSDDGLMPQPTPEHARLQEAIGTWDVKGKFYMDPSAPPMESTGEETVEGLGGFWVVGRYESDFMGFPFHGRGTFGFDPWNREYVSTWIDSMSPAFYHLKGRRDGDVITMEGPGVDPGTGAPVRYRTVETATKDRRDFSMFLVKDDGTEHRLFDMEYVRRG